MSSTPVLVVLVALGVCALCFVRNKKAGHLPLPPGPKPLPIIGNLCDLPFKDEVATYNKWAKEHGL